MRWKPTPMWKGGECFIIGGGPSMPEQFGVPKEVINSVCSGKALPAVYSPYLEPLHDKHVIGINNAYMLGSWVECVFFGDCSWYLVHRSALANFPGLKVTCCNRFQNKSRHSSEGIKFLARDRGKRQGITDSNSKVSWNHNSGAAAISLAKHFGVKRIILLGFDMRSEGKSTHWHRGHGLKHYPYGRHLRGFPVIAEDAKKLDIEIINASLNSAINCFEKVKLSELMHIS